MRSLLPKGVKVRITDGRHRGEVGLYDGPAKTIIGVARVLLGAQKIPHAIRYEVLERIGLADKVDEVLPDSPLTTPPSAA